jgi:hypothetical protein
MPRASERAGGRAAMNVVMMNGTTTALLAAWLSSFSPSPT